MRAFELALHPDKTRLIPPRGQATFETWRGKALQPPRHHLIGAEAARFALQRVMRLDNGDRSRDAGLDIRTRAVAVRCSRPAPDSGSLGIAASSAWILEMAP